MQSPLPSATTPPPKSAPRGFRGRPTEDVVYQAVTVGAILLVLGSLWIF